MRSARLAAATVLVAAFSIGLAGQVAPPATAASSALTPRTPWGDPDLQGLWNVASGTPLERPATYAGREFLTDEELLQAEKEANERTNAIVVETTNFSDKRLFLGLSAEHQRVVERFTRTADTFDCQFTIDDPTRWTKSWKAVVPIEKTDGLLYEFACHEGNYGLRNILVRGASAGKNRGRNKQINSLCPCRSCRQA